MNNVIVSFASGSLHESLLELSIKRFYNYALIHNYDLFVPCMKQAKSICDKYGWCADRPASWLKVPLVKYLLLSGYDNVLWLDCDIYINKLDINIIDLVKENSTQSFVVHLDKYEGSIPNCGVWILNKNSLELLDKIWNNTKFINHKWWEQGSNIDVIQKNSQFLNTFSILPYEFNVHKNDVRFKLNESEKEGCFLHATCYNNREEKMRDWNNNVYY
jgi:hypothetical protein